MIKNINRLVAAIVSAFTLLSANALLCDAANDYVVNYPNTSDTSWTGNSSPTCSASSYKTDAPNGCYARRKTNYSSVYVYNASTKSATMTVYGTNRADIRYSVPQKNSVSSYNGDYYATTVTIPAGGERRVFQFVKEKDYAYAHVHFTTPGTVGLWSPDCANENNYDPAN